MFDNLCDVAYTERLYSAVVMPFLLFLEIPSCGSQVLKPFSTTIGVNPLSLCRLIPMSYHSGRGSGHLFVANSQLTMKGCGMEPRMTRKSVQSLPLTTMAPSRTGYHLIPNGDDPDTEVPQRSSALERIWVASQSFVRGNVGLLLVAASQAFFSMMNVFVKVLNSIDPPVPALEVHASINRRSLQTDNPLKS